jgi:hypothetical protein
MKTISILHNMDYTKKLVTTIESTFISSATHVKTKPFRIKFNGKFITTTSGKTVWRNIGFAKLALLNHFQTSGTICNFISGYSHCKQIIKELTELGLIEYVEVDIAEYAIQKKF